MTPSFLLWMEEFSCQHLGKSLKSTPEHGCKWILSPFCDSAMQPPQSSSGTGLCADGLAL